MTNDRHSRAHLTEATLFGDKPLIAPNVMSEKFLMPPFSVLDAKGGEWQARKRAWIALGLKSDEGRELLPDQETFARKTSTDYVGLRIRDIGNVSIFDPVLCELMYGWFTYPEAIIYDPFAGGSVRGIVASIMGRNYLGCDIRQEQVAANEAQRRAIANSDRARWWVLDTTISHPGWITEPVVDFLFSCPPYGHLEVYSELERDISNMPVAEFMEAHKSAVRIAAGLLKPNRFAAWVVGDYRDHDGFFVNFPGKCIAHFEAAGLRLYNTATYLTPTGTLPLRASRNFSTSLKLGKGHQDVLIFVKGDPRKAVDYVQGKA